MKAPIKTFGFAMAASIAPLLVAGCTTVETKDVVADSGKYMSQNFTPAQLPPKIRAALEQGAILPDRFRTMRVGYAIEEETEGRKEEITSVVNFTNLGNEYIQIRTELSKNSIPYRINLTLSFGGIYRIKTQTVFLGRSNGLLPMEAKELTRFDRGIASPVKGGKYAIDSMTGTSMQLVNFVPENLSCVAGEIYPAAKVSPSLPGDAVSLECTAIGLNNVVVYKARYSWIFDYGVALQQDIADSRVKSKYTVTSVAVSR